MKNKKINKNIKRKELIINIVTIFSILTIFSMITSYSEGKKNVETIEYMVSLNQTLWGIADEICIQNTNKNLNIQNVIIEIKKVNNMTNSNIFEGQVLKVPIY